MQVTPFAITIEAQPQPPSPLPTTCSCAYAPAAALEPPPADAPPPRPLNVFTLSGSHPDHNQEGKAAALQRARGVVELNGVRCHASPAWSLELLQRAAPTVETLHVFEPLEHHLHAVHAMPRLRALHVACDTGFVVKTPEVELGALPPGVAGLRRLSARSLPRATLQSLLRAHGGTLEELTLVMGIERNIIDISGTPLGEQDEDASWPRSCGDLHSLLGRCGLRALRRLVLGRGTCSHTDTGCEEQLRAVRAALPGVQVLCDECDIERNSVPDPPRVPGIPARELDPPPGPGEMDAYDISLKDQGDSEEEKAAALQQAQEGVVRLVGVWCDRDPAWSLELLQRAARTVERLEVLEPRVDHLRAVLAMPRLRRLYVSGGGALSGGPPGPDALPPGHSGLRWLHEDDLPPAHLESLLRAHGGTLEELHLSAGTLAPEEEEFGYEHCSELPALLGRCGLRALRRLVLWRVQHTDTGCAEQLRAVRAALPGVMVLCDECDGAPRERP
ncbi:Transcription factor TGA2 [Frankliniella fusca]|uniref:Transcription factor TGA2 n=1 Tax=Frankliniella fusca TaxID=407009 RepID=A0AAE1HDV4_9NEOP|nr:Transcription factor TGA2 [Frankliniella fusca]